MDPNTDDLPVDCPDCRGRGEIFERVWADLGWHRSVECPTCEGAGLIDAEEARRLRGEAMAEKL
jgi:DnaJ-class molecular chaperone